eukprot:scaffold6916_cov119-Isochrysis_galbana.AAC.4
MKNPLAAWLEKSKKRTTQRFFLSQPIQHAIATFCRCVCHSHTGSTQPLCCLCPVVLSPFSWAARQHLHSLLDLSGGHSVSACPHLYAPHAHPDKQACATSELINSAKGGGRRAAAGDEGWCGLRLAIEPSVVAGVGRSP